jgi:hypothetical protein
MEILGAIGVAFSTPRPADPRGSCRDMEQKNTGQAVTLQGLRDFVLKEMQGGTHKLLIAQRLTERGVEASDAPQLVEALHGALLSQARREQVRAASLMPAMLGAGAAALVGGALWALIVVGTGYVIGYMAWGVGLLAGFAVVYSAGGRRGVPLQVLAVGASLLGITLGKYLTFYYFLKQAIANRQGAEIAARIPIVSKGLILVFVDALPKMLSPFDLLWVVLAVLTAWRIPRGLGLAVPEA